MGETEGAGLLSFPSPLPWRADREPAMPFLIRIMLALGGGVTAWFLSPDAPNFAVVQGIVSIAVAALILVVLSLFSKR